MAFQEVSFLLLQSHGARSDNPLDHQGKVIKGYPLCGTCLPTGFSKTTGEYSRQGTLAYFRKATGDAVPVDFGNTTGKCLVCVHMNLVWEWENAMATHTCKSQPEGTVVLQMQFLAREQENATTLVLACPSQGPGECCKHPHSPASARQWGSATTAHHCLS